MKRGPGLWRLGVIARCPVVASGLVWFRGVDVPLPLIKALRDGSLVIFVGAGASRASPSDLPDFRELTAAIAADACVPVADADLDDPDILLGKLEDMQVDVHRQVADRIGVGSSQPNQLHDAIASLAVAGPQVRIVTTNFDLHLSSALAAQGISFPEYSAPALPLGDDFDGVVYLHGCLRQLPAKLVVTDADFGQAYLRDAWATRFLERMFGTYMVLFVGYSHNDVVISYLGRGLRPDRDRFVLTADPDSPHWRRLRIKTIAYPNPDDTHSAVPGAISGWASWASMGLLDHRQQTANLLATPPSQVPEEMSYLEAVVADGDTVRFFTEYARGTEWLSWAAGQPVFRTLFDPRSPGSACADPLADWFAGQYIMDEALSDHALSVVTEAGGVLGPLLWSAIGLHLNRRPGPRPGWLSRWLVLMVSNAPRAASPWLDYALTKSAWPDDRAVALLLFDHLTEPQAVQRRSFALNSGTRVDLGLRGETYWLREAWTKVFVPNLAEAARDLIVIADRQLRRAHQLLTVSGTARPQWDPLCFARSAIEPHGQDSMGEPADVIIDAARDCLEALLGTDNDHGVAYLRMWAQSEVPLLRRLAVHGWACRTDVDGSAKLAWLRERGWLFDHQLRHEVFHLIAVMIADAAPEVADALVADAAAGPAGSQHQEYEAYNALAWIARHAPELRSAAAALAQAQATHPEYNQRPYPDLMAWVQTGWVGPKPPMSPEALHGLIEASPAGAITELRRYETAAAPFEGSTWDDALNLLSETIRDTPADGFAVLDADAGNVPDILRAVIRGWGATNIDRAAAEAIIERIGRVDLAAVSDAVASLLADGGQHETAPTEWHRIPAARLLAAEVWTVIDGTRDDLGGSDWLVRAINHPAGQLAQFWANAVAVDWQAAGDSWQGLPPATRGQFDAMLASDDDRSAMAEVIFASRTGFFHGADEDWCLRHVMPLLDWADPVRARRAWEGFLAWGQFNDQILAQGLLTQFVHTAERSTEFPDNLRPQLTARLATIALRSQVEHVTSGGWARELTAAATAPVRTDWLNQISFQLRTLPADDVEKLWHRWMRAYWKDRLAGTPVLLTIGEASAMAAWVVHLTTSADDGAQLATDHPAGIPQHSDLLRQAAEKVGQAPSAIARLLGHLLQGTQPPFYDCQALRQIVQEMRNQPAPPDMSTLLEQAVRLCGPDAIAP